MRLVFRKAHLSIEQFSPVEIPNFVVLTGVNGAGKSHLIEAIEQGHVATEGLDNPNIVHFNYTNFRLSNESAFNGQQLASEREQAWQFYQTHIQPKAQSWRSKLGPEYVDVRSECVSENKPFWSTARNKLNEYKDHFRRFMAGSNMRGNHQAQGIYSLAKSIPYSIDEIEHDDFIELYKPYQFTNGLLPNQLGKIFWDYYVKYRHNQLNAFENEKNGKNYRALSEQDFITAHGHKPWEVVNEILATFDTLKYRVNSPEGSDIFSSFQLKLQHIEKPDLEIDFSNLSSGERILMALVASVYKSSSDRLFPDLLLLDEVDASLHPSMMRNMLDVIEKIFLKQGVRVILVSHSPTTIALAPEEAIFVMNRNGPDRIQKKSKEDALSVLTEGFATIEQGLRIFDQVAQFEVTIITEGHNDAIIRRALELFGVNGAEVLGGVRAITGEKQLRTIFDFFCKVPHQNKVIVVWDCDTRHGLVEENKTYPYIIPKNDQNTLAEKGIENAFSESLMQDYIKTVTMSDGRVIKEFDNTRKADFAQYLVTGATRDDFSHFQGLIDEIERIKQLDAVCA